MRLVLLNGILLGVLAAASIGILAGDRGATATEASVRRYASAVSASDLPGAVAEIAPDQRPIWTDWVASQLGNVYDVHGIAVRQPAVLARLLRQASTLDPTEVTVFMDVDRGFPDQFFQPTTRVPVSRSADRWFLAAPLLALD